MAPDIQLDADFVFPGVEHAAGPGTAAAAAAAGAGAAAAADAAAAPSAAMAQAADPLGPLALLPGTWAGGGFNTIWRPHHPKQQHDRFLELNLTNEVLVFSKINGAIPNRGLVMPDINMFGVSYLQQISEAAPGSPALHFEPGIWATVPATTDPSEPATVVRMGSIPHGTVILAQGTGSVHPGGPPVIPDNNILPFRFGDPQPANSQFDNIAGTFKELNLSIHTPFRQMTQGITQALVKNPNSLLQSALKNQTVKRRTFLHVTTQHTPIKGGGLANTAFLSAASDGNANATLTDATFWIETIADPHGGADFLQLQYTQRVMLDFNGLHWPHVTVGTLRKQ